MALVVVATVVMISATLLGGWHTPYRVIAKPIERRLHIGKDEDSSKQPSQSPAGAATRPGQANSGSGP